MNVVNKINKSLHMLPEFYTLKRVQALVNLLSQISSLTLDSIEILYNLHLLNSIYDLIRLTVMKNPFPFHQTLIIR